MGTLYHVESNFGRPTKMAIPSRGFVYVDGDGVEIPVTHGPGWCYACDSLTSCERLRTAHDIFRALARIRFGELAEPEIDSIVADPLKRSRLAKPLSAKQDSAQQGLRLELKMIETRKSLARCLKCGSHSFVLAGESGQIALQDDRQVQLKMVGLAEIWGLTTTYNWEGQRVGEVQSSGPL